jgi:type IV pilus biogenesis protein CpaD/CtpE
LINRVVFAAVFAAALAGCASHPSHRRTPPQDPRDYHGVPTDDRPPSMLIAPAAPE